MSSAKKCSLILFFLDYPTVYRFLNCLLLLVVLSVFPVTSSASVRSDWLVLVYMTGGVAESSVGNASADIAEMVDSQIDASKVRVVIQTGGTKNWKLFNIPSGTLERYTVEEGRLVNIDSLPAQSMGASETLSDFLRFANSHYEAEHTMLIIWDHNTSGILEGVAKDEIFNDSLSLDELSRALAAGAEKLPTRQYDIVLIDADNTSTIDAVAFLQPVTRLFIGNEKIGPWMALDYTTWLYRLSQEPAISAEELARLMITLYMLACTEQDYSNISISLIDMTKAKSLLLNYNRLGCAITSNLQRGIITKAEIDRIALGASLYGNGPRLLNEKKLIGDLVDFRQFYTGLSGHFPLETALLEEDMKRAVTVFAKLAYTHGNGVSMYYPLSSVVFDADGSHELFRRVAADGYRSFMLLGNVTTDTFLNRRDLFDLVHDAAKNYKISRDLAENVSAGEESVDVYPYVYPRISSEEVKVPSSVSETEAAARSGDERHQSEEGTQVQKRQDPDRKNETYNPEPTDAGALPSVPEKKLQTGESLSSSASHDKTEGIQSMKTEQNSDAGCSSTGTGLSSGEHSGCIYSASGISPIFNPFKYSFIDEDEAKVLQEKVEILDSGEIVDTEFLVIENTTDACVIPKTSELYDHGIKEKMTVGKKKRQLNSKKRHELNQKYAVKEIDFDTYADSLCRYVDNSASFADITFCNYRNKPSSALSEQFKLPVTVYDDKSTGISIDPADLRNVSSVSLQIGLIHNADPKKEDDRDYIAVLGTDDRLISDWKKGEFRDRQTGTLIKLDDHILPAVLIASTGEFDSYASRIRVNHRDALLFFIHDLVSDKFRIEGYFLADRGTSPHLMDAKLKPGDYISYSIPVYFPVKESEEKAAAEEKIENTCSDEKGSETASDETASAGYKFVRSIINVRIEYTNEQVVGYGRPVRDPLIFRYEVTDSTGKKFYSDYQAAVWNDGVREISGGRTEEMLKAWTEFLKTEIKQNDPVSGKNQ